MSSLPQSSIRVRFAPSPTGHLHIGGLRTALFNFLFARHNNGQFLLRIEDTDLERSRKEYTDAILEALRWTDITPDEPVVIQSERIKHHQKMINDLVERGKAYRCYCSIGLGASKETYMKYDGACRAQKFTFDVTGKPYVVRIKLPIEHQEAITFEDLIRGPITISLEQLDDFIIARSDGAPVYNFVVVVDDHDMEITHIIRGEDHISNTPKQIVLYQAFGWQPPQFAHLPLIMGASGGRLSKRDAATSVLDYQTNGYLPEALCNYLARLGWSHGNQEIFTRQELIELFSIKGIGKSAAVFDPEKLDSINGIYMRAADNELLLAYIVQYIQKDLFDRVPWTKQQLVVLIGLYKERASTLRALVDEIILLAQGPLPLTDVDRAQYITPKTALVLSQFIDEIKASAIFDAQHVQSICKQLAKEADVKMPEIAQPIRLALLGKTQSPGVFDLLSVLGKETSIKRIQEFASSL
ncbi:MAG: glutamate--tRNA ligase [Candidatus Babeliales bacterium]